MKALRYILIIAVCYFAGTQVARADVPDVIQGDVLQEQLDLAAELGVDVNRPITLKDLFEFMLGYTNELNKERLTQDAAIRELQKTVNELIRYLQDKEGPRA